MIRNTFTYILTAFFVVGTLGALTGCNTIEGVGKDIEHGGKAIKDEAKEQKNKLN